MGLPLSLAESGNHGRAHVVPPRVIVFIGLILALTPLGAAPSLRLGAVHFPATGATSAQPAFQRGIAALHSFWYDEAIAAFREALAIDADFAMAWWGIAMAYHRPYLPGSDDRAGRHALAQIRDLARLTARETAYIQALRAYYAPRPPAERTLAYAAAMEKLHRTFPDDAEAATFFALSLLGYEWAADEGLARQERAAAIAEEVYRRQPNHPGAAHYIIHGYDEPTLASRGLEAARHYAGIAPDAAHALHMPSHIFLQLGMWREVADSNAAAWSASENWVRRRGDAAAPYDFHNLHWWIYASLQRGQYARAAELLARFRGLAGGIAPGTRHFLQAATAAYLVETRQWSNADALVQATVAPAAGQRAGQPPEFCGSPSEVEWSGNEGADLSHFAAAYAAAAGSAPDAAQRLAALAKAATANRSVAPFWRIRLLLIESLLPARGDAATRRIALLQQAAALQSAAPLSPGPPSAIKPPHEALGEALLAAGRARDAVEAFEQSLARHPNRALSLLGLARAEAAAARSDAATRTYEKFLETWREADRDRPELREAADFLAAGRKKARS